MGQQQRDLWSVKVPLLCSGLRQDALLDGMPGEGTVVWLSKTGQARGYSRLGIRIVRDGRLEPISEDEAVEVVDPARTAERRYRRAVVAAVLPERVTRFVEPEGHEWEADTVYPAGPAPGRYGEAFVACTQVRGRHVWRRAATWSEVTALGAAL